MSSAGPNPPRPPLFSPAAVAGYGLLLAAAVGLFAFALHGYPGWFDRYQHARPRYAAQRALEALKIHDLAKARAEVSLLQLPEQNPIYTSNGFLSLRHSEIYEGPVLRNRVQVYTQLAAELMRNALWPEAEAAAWKAILEYHVSSRIVEWTAPWECLYYTRLMQAQAGGTSSPVAPLAGVFDLAKILAAHGLDRVRLPADIPPGNYQGEAAPYAAIPGPLTGADDRGGPHASLAFALKTAYEADSTPTLRSAANLLGSLLEKNLDPALARPALAAQHRCLVAAGLRGDAQALLQHAWGRDPRVLDPFWNTKGNAGPPAADCDPTLLQMLWQDRPATATLPPEALLDFFHNDARVSVLDFAAFKRVETGYFNNAVAYYADNAHVNFFAAGGGALPFNTTAPVRRIEIAYASTCALGLRPIIMARIDAGAWVPLYADAGEFERVSSHPSDPNAAQPGLIGFDCDIPAGPHQLELWYLNDAGFDWPATKLQEDRNILLTRVALIHVAPQ